MAPKNILPRKKIADFIDNLYDGDLHAKRVLSLANATLGVLVSASLAVHAIGQGLAQALGKLSWPGGVPPARANSSVVRRGVEITTTALATPSGEDVDASFGPSAVLRTVWTSPGEAGASPPLAHTRRSRAHILTASATTIHENGDGTDSNRFPDCSVIPGNPSTEQTGELPWGFHETKRETTVAKKKKTAVNENRLLVLRSLRAS